MIVAMVLLAGCAQTKQYTPLPIGTQYNLSGMPANMVRVQVNDLRAEKDSSEQLVQAIKSQILSALSPEKTTGDIVNYSLNIDIIEHRSFFTLGNWNAATKLRIKLIDPKDNIVGNWIAEGNAHLSNMWGYAVGDCENRGAHSHNRHHELSLGFGGISPVLGYGDSIKGVWGCDDGLRP